MGKLLQEHVNLVVRGIGKLEGVLKANSAVVIAGGCIRSFIAGEKPRDIDVFTPHPAIAESSCREYQAAARSGLSGREETENAITVFGHTAVQFIKKYCYDTPEETIGSFDFTICKAAVWWDGSKWESVCHDSYYADLVAKKLRYESSRDLMDCFPTMSRVFKFTGKGYSIDPNTFTMLCSKMFLAHGAVIEESVISKASESLAGHFTNKMVSVVSSAAAYNNARQRNVLQEVG